MQNRVYKASSVTGNRKYIVDIVACPESNRGRELPTILLEINPGGGSIMKTYMYANSQILAQHNGNYNAPRFFYLHDRLGSVRLVINGNGIAQSSYTYNPFGEVIESGHESQAPSDDFMFTRQFYDSETGQYYLRARQYDPYISRFTSRDPVFGEFEEPMSFHRYLYCFNNPINMIDPLGLDAYLIYFPCGGPDWLEELLGDENAGHVEVAVDMPNGKVMVGSAAYGVVLKPHITDTLQEAIKVLARKYGSELKIMRFKNKTMHWEDNVTSDKRIYDYINGGFGKGMIYPYCSRYAQQALAYGDYQLGWVNGLAPSWLWDAAEWADRFDDNVSRYHPK
jgi:RHS repeat-associated protein